MEQANFLGPCFVVPADFHAVTIRYAPDRRSSYNELLQDIDYQLRDRRDLILIAESFSGPLALRYCLEHPNRVKALVLCASFVVSPVPAWLRHVLGTWLFQLPAPMPLLRRYMLGSACPLSLAEEIRQVIKSVEPGVMADRIKQICQANVSAEFCQCKVPMLYLQAAEDRLIAATQVQHLIRMRPDLQVQRIDGPHLLLQTRPQEAWMAIERFLSQCS